MDIMTKKFHLKKDKKCRYTADNLLIYNLIATTRDKYLSMDTALTFFSKFGPLKIEELFGKTRSSPKQYILKYESAEDASKALNQRRYSINGSRILTAACPSWEQPFDFLQNLNSMRIGEHLPSKLIHLEDNVLCRICSSLKLQDQVRLTLCHERFERIFLTRLLPTMPDILDINLFEKFSNWELRQVFKLCGKHLHGLRLVNPAQHKLQIKTITAFTKEFSTGLYRLQLIKFPHFNVTKLYEKFICVHNITELELTDSYVMDVDIKFLATLKNLRSLGLAHNRYICGGFIRRITTLKCLSLYACQKVSNHVLIDICRSINLIKLDIRLIYNIIDIGAIIFLLPNLEEFRFTRMYGDNIPSLFNLPKLTTVEMHFPFNCGELLTVSLLELSETSTDLIELKLTTDNVPLNAQMCEHLKKFKKLRRLALSNFDMTLASGSLLISLLPHLISLQELSVENCDFPNDIAANVPCNAPKLRIFSLRHCKNIKIDFIKMLLPTLKRRSSLNLNDVGYRGFPIILLMRGTKVPERYLGSKDYIDHLKYMIISSYDPQPHSGLLDEHDEQMRSLEKYTKHILYPSDDGDMGPLRSSKAPPINNLNNCIMPNDSNSSDIESSFDDEMPEGTFMDDSIQFWPF